jgi:tRNA-Thr(GGU) m(6)t(6)A37 methyltransferase TsaA
MKKKIIPAAMQVLLLLSVGLCSMRGMQTIQSDTMTIEYSPIGVFHSPLTPHTGAPRQGALEPEVRGRIEIFEPYVEALKDIERTAYIIVLYHMDRSGDWHTPVRPPHSQRDLGMFATRTPNRPNPIGFAVVRLEKAEGAVLHVSGIDAFDGTPVLDIKPWFHSIDCPDGKEASALEKDVGLSEQP